MNKVDGMEMRILKPVLIGPSQTIPIQNGLFSLEDGRDALAEFAAQEKGKS